ncbi:hypothetical protein, partial [Paraburkholderia aspalathi]|uniref:hypothetical protein n=1 Tax=Paraburkholderia aspalathi TaxID=1324617 RepID=UPI001BA94601
LPSHPFGSRRSAAGTMRSFTFLNIPLSGCPGLLDHYSAAPHRGNTNRPLTMQGKAPKPEQGKAPNPEQGKAPNPEQEKPKTLRTQTKTAAQAKKP